MADEMTQAQASYELVEAAKARGRALCWIEIKHETGTHLDLQSRKTHSVESWFVAVEMYADNHFGGMRHLWTRERAPLLEQCVERIKEWIAAH